MFGMEAMESMQAVQAVQAVQAGARHHAADDPCGSHDHAMVFHSCVCAEILFNGWSTTNELQLFASALAIFAAAALYEGFKYWRESLHSPAAAHSQQNIAKSEAGAPGRGTGLRWSRAHALQTALHALQAVLSYLLMLVFMTYNVWLCAAVVLGLTLGYFLFGWRRSALNDPTEHCQ